jgi:hypothetical protein
VVLILMSLLMVLFGMAVVDERIGAVVAQPPALMVVFVPVAVLASLRKLAPVEKTGWILIAFGFAIGSAGYWLGHRALSATGWLSMGVAAGAYAIARRDERAQAKNNASRRSQVLAFVVILILVALILLLPSGRA